MDTTKPFAFISYSRKDVNVATYLLNRIETYVYPYDYVTEENRPEDSKFVRPIYFDITDLSVKTRSFTEELKDKLANSRYLILICSPESAKSSFVKLEIEHFLATHNNDVNLILPVYIDNVFSGMHPIIDKILTYRNCPIYVTGKGEAGHIGRKYCFYHILEFLLNVDFSILFNRYEEYKKARTKKRRKLLAFIILIIIVSLSFAWYKQYRATIYEHDLRMTEHDLAQFEKETFPYSLVVGYVDNFLSPTLEALKDSLNPVKPHVICIMPNSYEKIEEGKRKEDFNERLVEMKRRFRFNGFETKEIRIKSRRRASSIVQMNFSGIKTPVFCDFVSTVKAIQSVVDYKFDPNRHKVKIDTTKISRDELVNEYSEQFIRQSKDRLGENSDYVHFVFSTEELLNVLEEIKNNDR